MESQTGSSNDYSSSSKIVSSGDDVDSPRSYQYLPDHQDGHGRFPKAGK